MQRPVDGGGDLCRVLHALAVAARGLADHLVVERLRQRRHGPRVCLRRVAVGVHVPRRALHRVPDAVVPHDEEDGDVLRLRDDVPRRAGAEDVRAVPRAAHDRLVRRRQLGPKRRAHRPAEAARRRDAVRCPRRRERDLRRVDAQLVHQDGVVAKPLAQLAAEVGLVDGHLVLAGLRPRVCGVGPVLARLRPLGRPLLDRAGVHADALDRVGEGGQRQPWAARQVQVGAVAADGVAGVQRVLADVDDRRLLTRPRALGRPGHVHFHDDDGVGLCQRRGHVAARMQRVVLREVHEGQAGLEDRHAKGLGQLHQRRHRPRVAAGSAGDQHRALGRCQRARRLLDQFRRRHSLPGGGHARLLAVRERLDALAQHLARQRQVHRARRLRLRQRQRPVNDALDVRVGAHLVVPLHPLPHH